MTKYNQLVVRQGFLVAEPFYLHTETSTCVWPSVSYHGSVDLTVAFILPVLLSSVSPVTLPYLLIFLFGVDEIYFLQAANYIKLRYNSYTEFVSKKAYG